MNRFENLFPENLYHSYIVEGDPESTAVELADFLKKREGFDTDNPDFLCQNFESFTVLDANGIKEWHSNKGITTGKKVCIIGTKFINREAEQSLLKMIEEPGHNTHFFIIVPRASSLLDTIRSRAHIIKVGNKEDTTQKNKIAEFIKESASKRIELVSKLIDANKDNETSGELRFQAIALINGIEKSFYDKFKKDKNDEEVIFILNELENSRKYLSTPGASVKMILEHIALIVDSE